MQKIVHKLCVKQNLHAKFKTSLVKACRSEENENMHTVHRKSKTAIDEWETMKLL